MDLLHLASLKCLFIKNNWRERTSPVTIVTCVCSLCYLILYFFYIIFLNYHNLTKGAYELKYHNEITCIMFIKYLIEKRLNYGAV